MPSTITDRLYGENSAVAIKAPCIAVSVANIALSGLGAFTTPNAGSYTPNDGDRILVIGQQDQTQNGIYNAHATAWQRTGDFDGSYDVVQGTLIVVFLPNGLTIFYQLITANPIIGTTVLVFAAVATSPNLNYPQTAAEGAAGVAIVNFGYPERDVRRYGNNAIPGTTDMTAAFTAALKVCQQLVPAGANVNWGAVCATVTANEPFGVTSVSIPSGCGLVSPDGVMDIIALSNSVGAVLDTPVLNGGNTPCFDITLRNVYVHGPGAAGTVAGLRLNNVQTPTLINVFFDNLPGPALIVNSKADGTAYNNMGVATSLTGGASAQDAGGYNIKAFNCLQNTAALTQRVGTFNIMGSDHDFYSCAAWNPLSRSLSSANKFAPAWNLVGVNESRFNNCKGSVSDQGWYLDANTGQNFFTNVRADANFAEGMDVAGSLNWFEQLDLNSNGQAANNTYDHIVFEATAGRNHIASGIASNGGGAANVNRYCVTDKNATTSSPNRVGAAFLMKDAATGGINNQGGALSVTLPDGAPQIFSNGAGTPAVVNGNQPFKNWACDNGAATNITNFTGGFVGQVIRVEAIDSVSTIVYNAALIRTLSLASINVASGQIYDFKLNPNGYWQQI